MNNKSFLLALNRIPGLGPRSVMKLQGHWPDLQEPFAMSQQDLENHGLSARLAANIAHFDMGKVDEDLAWETGDNHHILTWNDSKYPQALKEIYDPPMVLYAQGDLAAFSETMVAMVGTRKPSPTGAQTAWCFANELASHGATIVSGLAYGIDKAAHAGCLQAQGRTIAVMGTGIESIYPRAHRDLASKITENGLLLTEFPLKSAANAGHFPRRNRIISGLSKIILVVEAAIKSGSLITARLALEQNRDVMAIPGSIHNSQAQGCHYLLQQGAKLVTLAQDVLDELDIPAKPKKGTLDKSLPLQEAGAVSNASNSVKQHPLLTHVNFEVTSIDSIILRSGLNLEQVIAGLAQLEVTGIVKAIPGGYARCISSGIQQL